MRNAKARKPKSLKPPVRRRAKAPRAALPKPAKPKVLTPGEKRHKAVVALVRAFVSDWRLNLPAEAASGLYSATWGRWTGKIFEGLDGAYEVEDSGWVVIFAHGKFTSAVDASRTAFRPAEVTKIADVG